jgi:SAM-dependent methyltransferase
MSLERLDPQAADWARQSPDHLARYLHAATFVRGRRVLDAGTGMGYGAAILKTIGRASEVTAIDIDVASTDRARQLFGATGVDYRVDDCTRLATLSGHYDVVVNFENIEHLREPNKFLAAAARVTTPQGILLCSTPDRQFTPPFVDGKPANRFHVNEWYRDDFAVMLRQAYAEVDCQAQVMTHTATARLDAMRQLRSQVRANPFFFAKSWLMALRGTPWSAIEGIALATHSDYPVVPAAVAGLFGTPVCHFAICSGPTAGGQTSP